MDSTKGIDAEIGGDDHGIKPLRRKKSHKKLIAVILIALLAISASYIELTSYVHSAIATIPSTYNSTAPRPIFGSLSISSYGILTYNYSTLLVGYARARYSERNAQNASMSLTIYPENPSPPVYLVNVGGYCVQCFVSTSLLAALNSSLSREGLILNKSSLRYVDINQLDSVTPGSTVIIASGLIPNILLPNVTYTERCANYGNSSIISMLQQGDTIIYVGRNFSRSVSCSGQIALDTPQELSTLLPFYNQSTFNFTNSSLYLKNATFYLEPGRSLGPVTSAHILNGTLVALANYPSIGWDNNFNFLASDIAKVLASRFWMVPLAQGNYSIPVSTAGNYTVYSINSSIQYSNQASSIINSSYALLSLELSNPNYSQGFEIPFRYRLHQNGDIGMPPVIGVSQAAQISTEVFNSSKNQAVIAYVPILNSSLEPADNNPIHVGQVGPTQIFTFANFYLPQGYYIASLMDQYGSDYSSALFYVSNITISPLNLNFKNGTFSFTALSNGQPVSGVPYQISINNAYNETGVMENGMLSYSLPQGTSTQYGSGEFSVSTLGSTYALPYQYKSTASIKIPPLYIAFAIAAIVIIVLNRVLVPTNIDEYYIDVPDIKPVRLEHAKEPAESVLAVFDRVNNFYHWLHMPLTAEEFKAGISSNIKYGNTRMSITLRNAYAVLNYLVQKGLVQSASDYYAPTKWITESGYSMEYLVIYRKLKDYCIANAMLLTELGTSSKADVIVTSKGAQNYVKIYSKDMKLKEIEIRPKSKSFIVFIDIESKLAFLDKLYMSYSTNAELLKMAITYGNIKLLDSDSLDGLKL